MSIQPERRTMTDTAGPAAREASPCDRPSVFRDWVLTKDGCQEADVAQRVERRRVAGVAGSSPVVREASPTVGHQIEDLGVAGSNPAPLRPERGIQRPEGSDRLARRPGRQYRGRAACEGALQRADTAAGGSRGREGNGGGRRFAAEPRAGSEPAGSRQLKRRSATPGVADGRPLPGGFGVATPGEQIETGVPAGRWPNWKGGRSQSEDPGRSPGRSARERRLRLAASSIGRAPASKAGGSRVDTGAASQELVASLAGKASGC